MGKFVLIGVLLYLFIGLIFLRVTVTSFAKKKRENPDAKIEYAGCVGCLSLILWPLIPIAQLVMGGIIKDTKKLKQEIEAVEGLLKDEQLKVKQYEGLIETDPSTTHLFEDDLKESRLKCAKWETDLKKLKEQLANAIV
jgi:predicted RND superfamily exporter protein